MDKQCVTSEGGLTAKSAAEMGMKPNLLGDYSLSDTVMKAETSANTGNDPMTSANMRNWMECVRSRKQPNASIEAGYSHSDRAVHEHRRHPDRPARHLRRQDTAGDGRGQGLCVGGSSAACWRPCTLQGCICQTAEQGRAGSCLTKRISGSISPSTASPLPPTSGPASSRSRCCFR